MKRLFAVSLVVLLALCYSVDAARDFESGSNEFVDFGDPSYLDVTGDITLSLWVRLESTTAEMKPLAKWADSGSQFSYLMAVQTDGTARFATFTGGTDIVDGTMNLDDGQWHHVAGTYDGSNIRIYMDGGEEGSTVATGSIASTTAPFRLGAGSGGSGTEGPFDGEIGHGAIWDAALTDQEVASLAAGVSPLRIRRDNLIFYAPVNGQSSEPDVVGGASGTVTGTIVAEEPPIPYSVVAPG